MNLTWKRKRENKVSKEQQRLFQEDVAEDDEFLNCDEIDWLHPSKRKCLVLEDSNTKSERLKNEGCLLAEQGRLESFYSQFKYFCNIQTYFYYY